MTYTTFLKYDVTKLRNHPAVWLMSLLLVSWLSLHLPSANLQLPARMSPNTAASQQSPDSPNSAFANTGAINKTCNPVVFPAPAPLSADQSVAGLTQQHDQPTLYTIYGTTAKQLRSQVQQCGPDAGNGIAAKFTAQTSYNITWQYDIVAGSTCSVTNARVGLRTATALPDWQSPAGANTALVQHWSAFMAALRTHEQGHVTLDESYANQLVSDLNAVHDTDCQTLSSTVQSVANGDLRALDQANNTYDNQTDHGATQGAILP